MSRIKDALEKAKKLRGISQAFTFLEEPAHLDPTSPQPTGIQTRVIPYSQEAAEKHKFVTLDPRTHTLIERFKLLRTQILTVTQPQDERTLLITSCIDGEGKTFNAVNLAITFAREVDQTVLLVDANLKNPSILQTFGIHAQAGLTDYLLHNKPISEILIRPGIDKLTILPAGSPIPNSAEMLRSLKMKALIDELKNRYPDRYIFFDSASLLTCVDSLVLSKYIDRILLVVESGKIPPEKLREAIKLLEEDKILGTIFNKGQSQPNWPPKK